MKKIIPAVASLIFSSSLFSATCVPVHEYYPFEGKWVTKTSEGNIDLGMYARISPDGKYVLRSYSGKGLSNVTLMELVKDKKNSVKPFETPMKNEAFPVQGSWRYLVDVNGDHYKLSDILKKQKKADKQFKGGITGFYTVAAELKGSTASSHKIRSLSWPTDANETTSQGVGVLSNRVITASLDSKGSSTLTDKGSVNYMCANLRSTDGQVMSLPMISMDGSEFASMPQNPRNSEPSIRVYKFGEDNKSCENVVDLKISASKVTFSSPEQGMLLFYASGALGSTGNGVYFFDRKVSKLFTLDDDEKKVKADSYPGFTRDGRIVYGAQWEECTGKSCVKKGGYIVSDPYQSKDIKDFKSTNPELAKGFKDCITDEDIKASRDTQENIWSYSL